MKRNELQPQMVLIFYLRNLKDLASVKETMELNGMKVAFLKTNPFREEREEEEVWTMEKKDMKSSFLP